MEWDVTQGLSERQWGRRRDVPEESNNQKMALFGNTETVQCTSHMKIYAAFSVGLRNFRSMDKGLGNI